MATDIDLPTAALAEALFASDLSASSRHTQASVGAAIRRAIGAHGSIRGCAGEMAAAYGEHPETAAPRMRWVRTVVEGILALPAGSPAPLPPLGLNATPADSPFPCRCLGRDQAYPCFCALHGHAHPDRRYPDRLLGSADGTPDDSHLERCLFALSQARLLALSRVTPSELAPNIWLGSVEAILCAIQTYARSRK